MKVVVCLLAITLFGCDPKPATSPEPTGDTAAQPTHVNTDREAFKAAGKAAKEIENKAADRNSAVDDAIKAGE